MPRRPGCRPCSSSDQALKRWPRQAPDQVCWPAPPTRLFVDRVDLATGLDHFPGPAKSAGYDKGVPGPVQAARALGIAHPHHAGEDMAQLELAVLHLPGADPAGPFTEVEMHIGRGPP